MNTSHITESIFPPSQRQSVACVKFSLNMCFLEIFWQQALLTIILLRTHTRNLFILNPMLNVRHMKKLNVIIFLYD